MKNIFELHNLVGKFSTRLGDTHAINGISFNLAQGETLGIVGESGSGKSVTQMAFMRLLPEPPFQLIEGKALFQGQDLLKLSNSEIRSFRGNKISYIFQEPMTALNPYLKIGTQVMEPLFIHKNLSRKEAEKIAFKTLEQVWIADPKKVFNAYPHELSGGMRQRVCIAMAIITEPEMLIADEPTTALDVTVQAQILQLFKDLQKTRNMSMIFITHDFGVLAGIADRILVMYAGKICEQGKSSEIFARPQHPYTFGLLKSTPRIDTAADKLFSISGSPPDLTKQIPGCAFYSRCKWKLPECEHVTPPNRSTEITYENYCHLKEFRT